MCYSLFILDQIHGSNNFISLTEHCLAQASSSMQVLVMNLVLCFYFVNFSTANNMLCICVNFAADINRDVGKVKFKSIKTCIFYHSLCRGVAMFAIVGMWLMHLCIE